MTHTPDFKVTPLFDAEYLTEMVRDTDIVSMEGTYTRRVCKSLPLKLYLYLV